MPEFQIILNLLLFVANQKMIMKKASEIKTLEELDIGLLISSNGKSNAVSMLELTTGDLIEN